eukprot:NODE_7491_length_762_cov_612.780908_g7247_i0.p1 GENE.NODE_7491_length_762_cov_612.780908_g7247_i0~~NODE_7491_length_762_cov_612.780908_g7247_i0.p1  ORF type:complete len:228 (-),score=73.17 NODE_7491_length_762_cov_612.780908_g7247_i0:79-708(-)
MVHGATSRFWKGTIIDGRGHLLGRLAACVAKQLLKGQKVCVVRCDKLNVSGSLIRNKLKFLRFLRFTHLTNPKKGPAHCRSPSKMFWRVVRGMLPHKKPRGKAALWRLKVFDGMPKPWDTRKRFCCPMALRVLRLAPGRDCCILGDVANQVGWKNKAIVDTLEDKRRGESNKYYAKKNELLKIKKLAIKQVDRIVKPIKLGDSIKIGSL